MQLLNYRKTHLESLKSISLPYTIGYSTAIFLSPWSMARCSHPVHLPSRWFHYYFHPCRCPTSTTTWSPTRADHQWRSRHKYDFTKSGSVRGISCPGVPFKSTSCLAMETEGRYPRQRDQYSRRRKLCLATEWIESPWYRKCHFHCWRRWHQVRIPFLDDQFMLILTPFQSSHLHPLTSKQSTPNSPSSQHTLPIFQPATNLVRKCLGRKIPRPSSIPIAPSTNHSLPVEFSKASYISTSLLDQSRIFEFYLGVLG